MHKTIAALLAAVPLVACTSSPPSVVSTGAADDPRFQNVLGYLEQQLAEYDIPGASIAIVDHGQLFVAAGVGSKQEGGDAVDPATLFRVASLTKLVTASTALSLVDSGKLALDRPVTDYVPMQISGVTDPSNVLVGHLLDHTAGVPDISASTNCAVGAGQLDAFFAADVEPQWTTPGTVFDYSNRGFGIAGWVVEAAAGVPYEDAVTARVLGPAGMTTATFDLAAARAGDHATGYVHAAGGTVAYEPDAYDCAATRPASGVVASALDYASLAQTLLAGGGSMLSTSSVAALETRHTDTYEAFGGAEQYGYGLFVRDGWKGLTIMRHEGDVPGYQAALWMVPDQQFAVIVLYNASGREPSHVAARAVDEFLGVAELAAPVETSAPATWAAFAGTYFDPYSLGAMTVTFDGNALAVSVPSHGATNIPLVQESGNEFTATFDGGTHDVTFMPDATGTPQLFVTRDGVGVRAGSTVVTPTSGPTSSK